MEAQVEWHTPDPSLPIRQGDILIRRDVATGKVLEALLVITADCDIKQNKYGRHLACLRIMSLDDYVKTVWAERKLKKFVLEESKTLRSQIAKWHTRVQGSPSSLSIEAAVEWVRREDPNAICQALAIPPTDAKKMLKVVARFQTALATLQTEDCALSKYVQFRVALTNQALDSCRQEALKQAKSEPLPSDVFLLPGLPQVEEFPCFIMLREIIGIEPNSVHFRTMDAPTNQSLLRVGRLLPTFKYAVSQAFGALYSSIGLPPEYEERRDTAIESITSITWDKQ